MKYKIFLALLFLLPSLLYAQGILNEGAKIVIPSGVTLKLTGSNGNYTNSTASGQHGNVDLGGEFILEGNWANNATGGTLLNGSNGTVTFNGTGTTAISGSTSFYNFKCETAGKTLQFDATSGVVQTVSNLFTLSGANGNAIFVESSIPGSAAEINVNSSAVSNVTVSNSNNSGNTICTVNSIDQGNNTGWSFGPTAICQTATVYLDETGTTAVTPSDIDNGSYDACGIQSLSVSLSNGAGFEQATSTIHFDCDDIHGAEVRLNVTDVNGNESNCTAIVNIIDTVKPEILCPENLEYWICGSDTLLTVAQPQSSDACGVVSVFNNHTFQSNASGIYPVGLTNVQWIVTDPSGNTRSCTQTVNIHQKQLPNIEIIGDSSVCIGDAVVFEAAPQLVYCSTGCELETSYCPSASNLSHLMYIKEVGINNVENYSLSSQYSDYTNDVLSEISQDSTYVLNVTSYSYYGYVGNMSVHIDWDRDGVFEHTQYVDPSSQLSNNNYYQIPLTVPADADLGLTKIRIVLSNAAGQSACGIYPFGETEDYKVLVKSYTAGQFVSHSWSYNSNMLSNSASLSLPLVTAAEAGIYELSVIAQSGCVGTKQVELLVNNPKPELPFDTVSTMVLDTFLVDAGNYDSYSWQDGSVNNPYQIADYGLYRVSVTQNGCVGIDSMLVLEQQDIYLRNGWSMISTYINYDKNISELLQDVNADVIIVKGAGGAIYWPAFGVNTIGFINIGEAFLLKTLNEKTLVVAGSAVNPTNESVYLNAGSNLVAYLRKTEAPVAEVLNSIENHLEVVINDDGYTYWPGFNIDMIGNMKPGEGYRFKMLAATSLTYPSNASEFNKSFVERLATTNYSMNLNTGTNMQVAIPKVAWQVEPDFGDEVGIFNSQDVLVGAAVYNGGNMAITVWGNNEIDKSIAMNSTGVFEMRLWSKATDAVSQIVVSEWLEGDGTYKHGKVSVVGVMENHVSDLDMTIAAYPNPVLNDLLINYYIQETSVVKLSLLNASGQTMEVLYEGSVKIGEYQREIDMTNYPAGYYFVKLATQHDFKVVKVSKL